MQAVHELTAKRRRGSMPRTMARATPNPHALYIQYLLAKRGYTQNDVVEESGASTSMVSKIIARERPPSGETGAAVLKALLKLTGKRSPAELWPDPLP
jgi:hypothetical protein